MKKVSIARIKPVVRSTASCCMSCK